MKLRRNQLKPLQFEVSSAFFDQLRITPNELATEANKLGKLRDSFLSSYHTILHQPETLLRDYWKDRTNTELARVFKLANRLHQTVDRVLVFGIDDSSLVAKSLFETCCQPYWNESSRADRGSKPRIYFDSNHLDNDLTHSLILTLGGGQYQVIPPALSPELQRWALIIADSRTSSLDPSESETSSRELASQLYRSHIKSLLHSCTGLDDTLDPRRDLLIPITA